MGFMHIHPGLKINTALVGVRRGPARYRLLYSIPYDYCAQGTIFHSSMVARSSLPTSFLVEQIDIQASHIWGGPQRTADIALLPGAPASVILIIKTGKLPFFIQFNFIVWCEDMPVKGKGCFQG